MGINPSSVFFKMRVVVAFFFFLALLQVLVGWVQAVLSFGFFGGGQGGGEEFELDDTIKIFLFAPRKCNNINVNLKPTTFPSPF